MDNVAYLLTCSDVSRDNFTLAKLDQAAQLRKQIAGLIDKWVEAEAYAMLGDIIREAKYTAVAGPATVSISDILNAARRQLKPAP